MDIINFINTKRNIALIVLAVAVGVFVLGNYVFNKNVAKDYKNATYIVGGRSVTLKNGVSEEPAAFGSETKIITRYFGNEVKLDLNNDKGEDVAFILTQETGGSGTFYYVVAALNKEDGYLGSNAFLLGDRIAPQTTEKKKGGVIVVNYADRKSGQDFAVVPSVSKSAWLLLNAENMQFNEVARNFEGDVSKMSLGMRTWAWVKTSYGNDTEVVPLTPKKFEIIFWNNGSFAASTDCNNVGGRFTAKNGQLTFSGIFATKKVCVNSQESVFRGMLINTVSYHFTALGELVLDLKNGSGSMTFR